MTKTKFYKTATLAMTLSMVVGSVSFASTQPISKTSNIKPYSSTCVRNNNDSFNIKTKLDGLVKAGTITQAQENVAIKLATNTKREGFKKGNEMKVELNGLVKAGTITQVQENAIVKLATTTIKSAKGEMKTGLDGLVTSKTITQAQENAVVKLATNNKREDFNKGNGIKVKLNGLVKAGTITQVQENAMISALR